MANENNKILLNKFIKNNSKSECLVIHGDFGIGKTSFITEELKNNDFIKDNKILYSINNNIKDFEINNLKKNIILNSDIQGKRNKIVEYGLKEGVAKEIMNNNSFSKKYGIGSLSKILENKYLNNVKFDNQIIVLDELERILTTKEKINEFFYSLINLKENNKNIKIILILNENGLEDEVKESLNKWNEKIIDYTINIEKIKVSDKLEKYLPQTSNLRILQKMENILINIEEIKNKQHKKIDLSKLEEYKKEIIRKIEKYYSSDKEIKTTKRENKELINRKTIPLFLLDEKRLEKNILDVCKFEEKESSLNEKIEVFYKSINEFFVNQTNKKPEETFNELFDEVNKRPKILSTEPVENKFLLLNLACEGYEVFINIKELKEKIESKLIERIKQKTTKRELIKIRNWINSDEFDNELGILEREQVKILKRTLKNKLDLDTLIKNKKNDDFEKIENFEDIETEEEFKLLLEKTEKLNEILNKEPLNKVLETFTLKRTLIYKHPDALNLFKNKITKNNKYNFESNFLKYKPPL